MVVEAYEVVRCLHRLVSSTGCVGVYISFEPIPLLPPQGTVSYRQTLIRFVSQPSSLIVLSSTYSVRTRTKHGGHARNPSTTLLRTEYYLLRREPPKPRPKNNRGAPGIPCRDFNIVLHQSSNRHGLIREWRRPPRLARTRTDTGFKLGARAKTAPDDRLDGASMRLRQYSVPGCSVRTEYYSVVLQRRHGVPQHTRGFAPGLLLGCWVSSVSLVSPFSAVSRPGM